MYLQLDGYKLALLHKSIINRVNTNVNQSTRFWYSLSYKVIKHTASPPPRPHAPLTMMFVNL